MTVAHFYCAKAVCRVKIAPCFFPPCTHVRAWIEKESRIRSSLFFMLPGCTGCKQSPRQCLRGLYVKLKATGDKFDAASRLEFWRAHSFEMPGSIICMNHHHHAFPSHSLLGLKYALGFPLFFFPPPSSPLWEKKKCLKLAKVSMWWSEETRV